LHRPTNVGLDTTHERGEDRPRLTGRDTEGGEP
jgi:hypothetical protein